MKNSLWPLILLGATFATLPMCIHRNTIDARGSYGPQLFSGPVRGDEKNKVIDYDTATLSRQVRVSSASVQPSLELHSAVDKRRGLEVVPWDRVVISLDDDHVATRAVAKALGELMTSQIDPVQPYAVTLLLTSRGSRQVIPLPSWRLLRVSSVGSSELPQQPGGSASFSIQGTGALTQSTA